MLFTLLRNAGDFSFWELLVMLFGYAVLVLVMLPIHELAHGWTATALGDQTARWHGRLSFNPFAHLDLWGTLMLFAFGFGYARPVPVNPRNFRSPRRDMALVAAAGPLSNVLMALISLLAFSLLRFVPMMSKTMWDIAYLVFVQTLAYVNISLAVFNLLPIPPLDGSRILSAFVPYRVSYWLQQYEQYIRIALFVALAVGVLDKPLNLLSNWLFRILCTIVGL